MKTYCFEITLKFSQKSEGKNKREAIEALKESFYDEFNLDVDDSEIKEIK